MFNIKKVFCTFIIILLLLLLISCGVNPAAKYPIMDIVYEHGSVDESNSTERLQGLGYSSVDDGSESVFVYTQNGNTQNLSKGGSIINSEFSDDNESEYFIVNFWSKKSWEYATRYGLHENGYIISLDDGTRWDFKKGQIVLSVNNGYAYYVEGVKIYKVNLQDEKDKEVVYTFPFKKKLPKTPIVNIEGVETELYSTYTFVINEDGILIQSKIRDSDDVYTFADIKY